MEHITVTRDSTVKWKLDNVYPTSGNNGNVTSQTVDATGAGGVQTTATYGYDRLNRLVSVGEGAGGVGQVYGYDSVGNRWLAGHTNWEPPAFTPVGPAWYEGATNRMVNAALPVVQQGRGNLTAMAGYGLEYDAEDREVKATLGQNYAQYWYDGGRAAGEEAGAEGDGGGDDGDGDGVCVRRRRGDGGGVREWGWRERVAVPGGGPSGVDAAGGGGADELPRLHAVRGGDWGQGWGDGMGATGRGTG